MECIPLLCLINFKCYPGSGETISISREVGERKLFESSGEKNFPLIIPFGTFASGTSDDLPGKKCRYPLSVFAGSL